ncbi:MAG: hypothetical protein M3157_03910 [Actinomycetota bacterium]|nr:hypothetical protein [Actinomycetota bacterium]
MGIAVISLIVLAIVALIIIPVLVSVFGRASRRNPNRPGNEDSGGEDQGSRSGPRRD